jgi:predicted Zn-dependent peptidase
VEIREKRGLAYVIQSNVSHHLDTGCLVIYDGVDPAQLPTTVKAIVGELGRLKNEIPQTELTKAKEMAKGRLLLRMEDTRSVAGWLGGQELLLGNILTVDEVVSTIDSVQADDLPRVAQQIFTLHKLNLAVVGPVDNHCLKEILQL